MQPFPPNRDSLGIRFPARRQETWRPTVPLPSVLGRVGLTHLGGRSSPHGGPVFNERSSD